MAVLERYDPGAALKNPEAYFADAFDLNVPNPRTVRWVGRAAKALSQPHFHFMGGVTADQYFADVSPDTPLIITLSHAGKQRLHDTSGGAAAVFEQAVLRRRIPKMRIWAAVIYLSGKMGEVMSDLGTVPVIRPGDYEELGYQDVPEEDKEKVTTALIDESAAFLNHRPGRTLDVFPAGTKGAKQLRSGVVRVASQVPGALILPISMTSPREEAGKFLGNLPLGMHVVYGSIQELSAGETMEAMGARLQQAQDDAYESACNYLVGIPAE